MCVAAQTVMDLNATNERVLEQRSNQPQRQQIEFF